jgi:hypothetical protein
VTYIDTVNTIMKRIVKKQKMDVELDKTVVEQLKATLNYIFVLESGN